MIDPDGGRHKCGKGTGKAQKKNRAEKQDNPAKRNGGPVGPALPEAEFAGRIAQHLEGECAEKQRQRTAGSQKHQVAPCHKYLTR